MDFSTMQPRILYASTKSLPPTDSYLLDGWDKGLRPIIKKAFSQLINSDQSSRNENQWHRFAPDFDPDPLPESWGEANIGVKNRKRREVFLEMTGRDYSELLKDLLRKHAPIDDCFFSKTWGSMQSFDSQIAEKIMVKLLENDPPITSLPIHDSFIVSRGAEKALQNAMEEAFYEVIDADAKIDRDDTVYDPPEGMEVSPLINAEELFDSTAEHLSTHSLYHIREYQWTQTYGPIA